MGALNTRDTYGWTAKALHWLSFVIIVALIGSGKFSSSLPSGDKIFWVIGAHKQIAIVLFLFVLCRLAVRFISTSPEHIGGWMSAMGAGLVHLLIYLTLMLQVYIGIAMSQLSERAVLVFNLFEIPDITASSDGLLNLCQFFLVFSSNTPGGQMRELHTLVGDSIIVLIGLHIAGALMHHVIFHDDTLRRMMPGYKPLYHKNIGTPLEEPKKKT